MTAVLVVGGAGYIGSLMVKMLLNSGHKVIVYDNLSRGNRDAVGKAELVVGDILDPARVKRLFTDRRFDAVMHFAALTYVGESVEKPALYYGNNVNGTINLLDAMLHAGLNKVVFSSTCATYGNPVKQPISEDHPQCPINPYGKTKLIVEGILADYATAYGLQSVTLRYFNAAGCDPDGELGERHDPETHLIPLVLREALRVQAGGDPELTELRVFGDDFDTPDNTCIRDYIHVQDICSAHILAMEHLLEGKTSGFEVFNLGNGQGHSVKQVIDACRKMTGIDIRYKVAGRRPGDPSRLVGSADKAKLGLGWKQQFDDLETIIETAWHYTAHRRGK